MQKQSMTSSVTLAALACGWMGGGGVWGRRGCSSASQRNTISKAKKKARKMQRNARKKNRKKNRKK